MLLKPHQVNPALRVAILHSTHSNDSRTAIAIARLGKELSLLETIHELRCAYLDSDMDYTMQIAAVSLSLYNLEGEDLTSTDDETNPQRPRRTRRQAAADTTVPAPMQTTKQDQSEQEEENLEGLIRAAYPKTKKKEDQDLFQIIESLKTGCRRISHNLIRKGVRIKLGQCTLQDSLLRVQERTYVPEGELRTKVCNHFHRSMCGGHGGKHESYAKIAR